MVKSMTSFDQNKTLFLTCDCGSEVLRIEYDHEIEMADFAVFSHDTATRHRMSLWQRLRYACQVLFYKKPYADQMVLNKKQLVELKHFLESLSHVNR
jgi:hypothetical protein